MKSRNKILIACLAAVGVGGLALAGAGYASGWKGERHHGGYGYSQAYGGGHHGHRHGGGMRMERMLERFDSNGDGEVSLAELEQGQAGMLAAHDSDKNGALTLSEFEGVWLEFTRDHMVDRFQHLDGDGDGNVTGEELNKHANRMVRRMDRNGDGKIGMSDWKRKGDRYMEDDDDDDS